MEVESWGSDHDLILLHDKDSLLPPQRCVLKGPKMLHWLPALSGLVATRPGLRVALGIATILLIFAMAIASLVRAEGPYAPPSRHARSAKAERGPLDLGGQLD